MKILAILLLTVSFFSVGCAHKGKCKRDKMAKHFSMMDKDGDGAISKKEFDAKKAEKWTAMDADKNGKVTMEEMKAYKKSKCKKCNKKKACASCGDKKKKDCDKC